eukprot:274500-Chlamydomonas_euryale.AAC.1
MPRHYSARGHTFFTVSDEPALGCFGELWRGVVCLNRLSRAGSSLEGPAACVWHAWRVWHTWHVGHVGLRCNACGATHAVPRRRGSSQEGTRDATLCLPCHTPPELVTQLRASFPPGSELSALPWAACPCTARSACAHRHAGCELESNGFDCADSYAGGPGGINPLCGPASSAYGGAGFVVSDAMMRALPLDEMHAKADGLYRW